MIGLSRTNKMRIFVTGASGFIGSHLVDILLQAGCEVAILAAPGDAMPRLRGVLNRLTLIPGDLNDSKTFSSALSEFHPEVCFHLAWYVEPGKYLNSPQNITYLVNSLALLQFLIDTGCQHVVMTGTCAEYETGIGVLKETSPTNPSTLYAAAKLSLSILGTQMAKDAGIRFAWARIFYLYGDMEDPRRMVPALINSLMRGEQFDASTGEQVRDYLHVYDVASALFFIARHQLSGIYNISSGEPITIRLLMETIGDILGRKELIQFGASPLRQWEPDFICGDSGKLKSYGWQPKYNLCSGLEDTIRWWQRG